jgi:hypothetical protein
MLAAPTFELVGTLRLDDGMLADDDTPGVMTPLDSRATLDERRKDELRALRQALWEGAD